MALTFSQRLAERAATSGGDDAEFDGIVSAAETFQAVYAGAGDLTAEAIAMADDRLIELVENLAIEYRDKSDP
jgi:hypothetical protein